MIHRFALSSTVLYALTVVVLIVAGCSPASPVPAQSEHQVPPEGGSVQSAETQTVELPPPTDNLSVELVADGSQVDPFANPENKAVVLIFVCTDCPVANRYAPELRRLAEKFGERGAMFYLVYADPAESSDAIRQHLSDYQHQTPALRDPEHLLVKFCGVTRTPEAALFSPGHIRCYRGRIDDQFTDYGKSREVASQHDLEEAIEAVLNGKSVAVPVTEAVGCYIPGVTE